MSATRIVYVHCDACGTTNPDAADEQMSASDQRKELARIGWRNRPGGRDYCGDCVALGSDR